MIASPERVAIEVQCPYGCANRKVFDPERRFCNLCGGWLNFCPSLACRVPNRIFARFCRHCRTRLDAWESWSCFSGDPTSSGRIRKSAPWKNLPSIRLTSPWAKNSVCVGAEAPPSAIVASFGTVHVFTVEGNLVMIDMRDGSEIDRVAFGEDPVALFGLGERLVAVSQEKLRLFSILGRASANYSAPVPSGYRRLWERQVPGGFPRYVGHPIPYGSHLVQATAGRDAFGLCCLKLKTHEDLWENDPRTFPGEFAFVLPWAEASLIVGNKDGLVVGLTGVRGTETFRFTVPGGLCETFPRACVDEGRMYWFNAVGELWQIELTGRRTPRPVGGIQTARPSILGVCPNQIVVGDRQGTISRYNPFGLDPQHHTIVPAEGESQTGFTLPPILTEDGCLLAASDSGSLLFFGPRSSAAPIERMFSFPSGSHLRSLALVGSILTGINSVGEVQALKIRLDEEAT